MLFAPVIAAFFLWVASCGSTHTSFSPDDAAPDAASPEASDAPSDRVIGPDESPPPCTVDALPLEAGAPFFCPVVLGGEAGETCWSGSQYCSQVVSAGQFRPALVRTCFDFPCGCGAEPSCKCLEPGATNMGCPYCSDDAGMVVLGCVAP